MKIFNPENPLMRFLTKVFDCIALNVLWVVFSLPIFTIGAASTAVYTTIYHHIRLGEGYFWSTFRTAFKENFKRSTLAWLPLLFMLIFLIFDVLWLRALIKNGQPLGALFGVILVFLAVAIVWGLFLFAYCARFNGTAKETIRYSFYLMMAHPFRSLAIMLIQLATLAVLLLVPGLAIVLPSASVWASSFLIEQIFLKHMQPADVEKTLEEQQTPED